MAEPGGPPPGFHIFPAAIVAESRQTPTSVDFGLLQTTAEGFYSTMMPAYTGRAAELIMRHCPSPRGDYKAFDATANIGGDTLNILHNFPQAFVVAAETDPANFQALEANLEATGLRDRCRAVLGSCLDVVGTLGPQDFVIVDPPWGGPEVWKGTKPVQLSLSGADGRAVRVEEFIEAALGVAPTVVLKAPPNFDDGPICDKYETFHEIVCKPRKGKARRRRDIAYLMYFIRARGTPHA